LSLLFLRYKILDNIRDKPFGTVKMAFLKLFDLPPPAAGEKAAAGVALRIDAYIGDLHRLEEENCRSWTKSPFFSARFCRTSGKGRSRPRAKRIAGEMLKTLGRWIYILDALGPCRDEKNKAYNLCLPALKRRRARDRCF
jgi:hypothetical protein